MEKEKILEIVKSVETKNNKDLVEARDELGLEYAKTKEYIIDLTHHLDAIQTFYDKINNELAERYK